jgi:hypothetical protein
VLQVRRRHQLQQRQHVAPALQCCIQQMDLECCRVVSCWLSSALHGWWCTCGFLFGLRYQVDFASSHFLCTSCVTAMLVSI